MEGRGAIRAAVTDQKTEVPEPLAEIEGQVAACCAVQSPVGWAVTPPRCIRRVPCSTNTSTYSLVSATVSTCRKSAAKIRRPVRAGTAARPGRPGAVPGQCLRRAGFRRRWTARLPRPAWSVRHEYAGSPTAGSLAPKRMASRAMLRTVAGRPGRRRLLVSYFLVASLRCQASSMAGVTGKTSAQRRRGMNRVSAANQTRSAGSYRTRPAFRRSTAFSCQSTSNSAFFVRSPAEHQHSQAEQPAHHQTDDLEQHRVSQPSPHQPRRRNGQTRSTIEFPGGIGLAVP